MIFFQYISTTSLLLLFNLSLLTTSQTISREETYSLGTVSNFRFIRPCVVCCFDSNDCGVSATDLPDALGCTYNSCLCRRVDIRTSASSFLNECVSRRCSGNPADVSDAQVAYQAYCSVYLSNVGITTGIGEGNGGGETGGGDQIATMTVAAGTTTVTVGQVTSFVIRVSTFRDSPAEGSTGQGSGNSSSGLGTAGQVSLGVGLGIGIPALGLLAYITYLLLKQREREVLEKNGNAAFRPGGIMVEGVTVTK
ncbi:hypothetical protein TWF481_000319 [Arthrobotrys musiformis]|uniref:Extracellular membrane protein CFEM domain-containing protein n=1 Tax=Arthrobotrys musiformis TaxID=47236 RepID=A0AAV9WMM1_9PEZI